MLKRQRGIARPPSRVTTRPNGASGSCTHRARVSSRTRPKLCAGTVLAADQGQASTQYNLGVMYATGRGVLKDDAEEEVRWYRLAAEQGDAAAQFNLGVMYAKGAGRSQGRGRSGALVPSGRRPG